MRFKGYRVFGFPRSGSCVTAYLVGTNFFGLKALVKSSVSNTTSVDEIAKCRKNNHAIICTWRNFMHSAKSLYEIRSRFGVGDIPFSDFLDTPLRKMPRISACQKPIVFNDGNSKRVSEVVTAAWSDREDTVREWWARSLEFWTKQSIGASDVLVTNYESLVSEFHGTMLRIAVFLGSEKRSFENRDDRVGIYSVGGDCANVPERSRAVLGLDNKA
jgi:hypothetical protein